jgi:hypothetical protein
MIVAVNQIAPQSHRPRSKQTIRVLFRLSRPPLSPLSLDPLSSLSTAAAPCCTLTPATHSPPPTESKRLRQDLAAGVDDLHPVLALAVQSGWRLAPPSCSATSRTIWDLGAPPPGPSLPRCTSCGRRPKEEEQQRPALEDVLHGALEVGLISL